MDDLKDKSETGQSDSVLEDEEMLNPANAESQDEESEVNVKTEPEVTKRSILTLIILVLINLLNYMDRYTIAGMIYPMFSFLHRSYTLRKFLSINTTIDTL